MRRGVTIFLILNIIVIGLLVRSVWTLLSLLVVDGSNDQISRAELPAPNSTALSDLPQLIPKIIHQTYVNESIPAVWAEAQQSCIDLHEDYEYKVRLEKSIVAIQANMLCSSGRTRSRASLSPRSTNSPSEI